MRNLLLSFALAPALLLTSPAHALPRDAAATLNRCGQPLFGDETILENTVAGGRRLLKYERGTLTYNRVARDGWTFVSGVHHNNNILTATEMEQFMPCLKDALADSAAVGPLPVITSYNRAQSSIKRAYQTLVIGTLSSLGLLGAGFFVASRKARASETLAAQ